MSSDSLAYFRKHRGEDLKKLAEKHLEHDLPPEDRDRLKKAGTQFSNWTAVGSLVGLGLGSLLALRVRTSRIRAYHAFRVQQKPTHIKFADGREEALPDLNALARPSLFGDMAAYFFFSLGGLFVGGELGLLTGSVLAGRTITEDPAARSRIEIAFHRFRADALKKEAEDLERYAPSMPAPEQRESTRGL